MKGQDKSEIIETLNWQGSEKIGAVPAKLGTAWIIESHFNPQISLLKEPRVYRCPLYYRCSKVRDQLDP